ncbi:MAG TPA: tyrosine-type recombinase/integrase [Patescibacteria group bacterium]|nr:tyrosine-type recombinase/integrase [Patescibacteria group bacterium]
MLSIHNSKRIRGFFAFVKQKAVGWYILRHTFASQLVAEGAPLIAVKELLGHASITMTMRYAHLQPSAFRSAVDVLQRAEDRETAAECQPAVNLEQLLATVKIDS